MNRLWTLIIMVMTVGLVTSYAWAGESQAKTDQHVSYQELSPAVFFGYTDVSTSAAQHEFNRSLASHTDEAKELKDAASNYDELSPAEFFGYAIPHLAQATTTMADSEQVARVACCRLKSERRIETPVCCKLR